MGSPASLPGSLSPTRTDWLAARRDGKRAVNTRPTCRRSNGCTGDALERDHQDKQERKPVVGTFGTLEAAGNSPCEAGKAPPRATRFKPRRSLGRRGLIVRYVHSIFASVCFKPGVTTPCVLKIATTSSLQIARSLTRMDQPYKAYADEAMQLAGRALKEKDRQFWLNIARAWLALLETWSKRR